MELDAAAIAAEYFGITATAQPLPGEIDLNARLTSADGSIFALRVSPRRTDPDLLELQSEILSVLNRLESIATPWPVPSLSGNEIAVLPDGRLARVFTWVLGTSFAEAGRPPAAARTVGQTAGRIVTLLGSGDHPAAERDIEWDLRFAAQVIAHRVDEIDDGERRQLVTEVARRIEQADLGSLPHQVIHNDLNDENVLFEGEAVVGVIDVGDAMWTLRIAEPAIAAAYVMLDQDDPITVGCEVIRGFADEVAVTAAEANTVFDLILARLATSVVMSAHRGSSNPHHAVSEPLAWDLLERLMMADQASAAAEFAAAAGHGAGVANGNARLRTARLDRLGPSLSLSYAQPLHIVRGQGACLYDDRGRRYLDAVNNVAHVGHSHPAVVAAAARQMAILNTNTRYLHEEVVRYAARLAATLPAPLEVVYLVNSGSEANELAIRLIRAATGSFDLVCLDHGYHGNTSTLVDVSPYKFKGLGGAGRREWVEVLPAPDSYRFEEFRGDQAGANYGDVARALLAGRDRTPAGLIVEALPGCAGQLVPEPGVLDAAYAAVREVGGLVIADEVQTGFGRVGEAFWAFELHGVVPDVVTMGKPIGNGHPLGAVVTTRAIADAFDNGMEYFNTFGGNPVSAAVGNAVLDVIEAEELQANAAHIGGLVMDGLREVATHHEWVADVRGRGLFLGVELAAERDPLRPASAQAAAVVEHAKAAGVLLSIDGPDHNVIKIKPPLVLSARDGERLVAAIAAGLHHAHR